jgi:hypothetical protein
MNNEPVAWMNIHGQFNKKETWLFPIPLYTHPAKELTDEEILKMAANMFHYSEYRLVIEFARAVIKLAQEK